MYIFVQNIQMLILLQIILGIGEAFGTPGFEAIFAEHLDPNRHVKEYAQYQLFNNAAIATSTIAGGLIVKAVGFPVLFIAMATLAAIAFIGVIIRDGEEQLG